MFLNGVTDIERDTALSGPTGAAKFMKQVEGYSFISDDEAQLYNKLIAAFSAQPKYAYNLLSAYGKITGQSAEKAKLKSVSTKLSSPGKLYAARDKYFKDIEDAKAAEEAKKAKEAEQKALLDPLQKQVAELQAQQKAVADKAAAEKAAFEKQLTEAKEKLKPTTPSGKKVRTTESVSIRSAPAIDKKNVLSKVSGGTQLDVSSANSGGEFTAIVWKGALAYVASKYIKDVSETTTSTGKTKVTTSKTTVASTKKSPSIQTTTSTPQIAPTKPPEEEGLSTGSKVAIAGGAVAVIGLIVYFATRKK